MPDSRSHRGPHPKDPDAFGPAALSALRRATADLSWLLTRGYAIPSALKLVGDRHGLIERQRQAVLRSACSDHQLQRRADHQRPFAALGATRSAARATPIAELWVDGFNVLLTVEVAMGGGVVLLGRDGCARDIASVHGTYRRVVETEASIDALARVLERMAIDRVHVVLDAPVSNSGRLAAMIRDVWTGRLEHEVHLEARADARIVSDGHLVASADSAILDRCTGWINLARQVVGECVPEAWVVDLG